MSLAAKRFWTETAVAEAEGGFTVTLDGRALRTPAKAPLVVPTRALAEAIRDEWEAQEEKADPATMPLTRTANSAIDKVSAQHDEVAAMLAAYGETDLLCYRAEGPDALVARQEEGWNPLLDWAAEALGARLEPVSGIMPRDQDTAALARLKQRTHAFDAFELAAFHDLVALTGSLVLAFAVEQKHTTPETAWALSRMTRKPPRRPRKRKPTSSRPFA